MVKIISWNVNSIRKGVSDYLEELIKNENPDIICFQETKASGKDIEEYFSKNYKDHLFFDYNYRYWNDSIKGQACVGIISKIEPINTIFEIPLLFTNNKGRILVCEFEDFMVLNTYVPNTGRGQIAEDIRNVWHNGLIDWLPEQIAKKKFVWCGDLNVVNDPALDTSHYEERPKKNPCAGLKQFEKDHFDEYLSLGLFDSYRELNPDLISFTWFSNFRSDVGWRLDYFLVNNMDFVKEIKHNKRLPKSVSDHTWILIEIN